MSDSAKEPAQPAKGQGQWRRWRFGQNDLELKGELLRVWVDPPDPNQEVGYGPCRTYVLDADLRNNSWQARSDRRPARRRGLRRMLWLQTVLSFFGGVG